MVPPSEHQARETINKLLTQAGWLVCDAAQVNIHAARGVAIREFPLAGQGSTLGSQAEQVCEAQREIHTIGANPFEVRTLNGRPHYMYLANIVNIGQSTFKAVV